MNFINSNEPVNYFNATDSSQSLFYIKNYYKTLLFNFLLNEYEQHFFKIFSPFSFESSNFRQCKLQIDSFIKNDKVHLNLKIFGCVFYDGLDKLINFLSANFSSFSMKLSHFMKSTNYFYKINPKLKTQMERVEYRNNTFYIK